MVGREGSAMGSTKKISALRTVLKLLMPSHLNGLEFAFVRSLWIAGKPRQLGHVLMQIGEANGKRIQLRMSLRKQDAQILSIIPIQSFSHKKQTSKLATQDSQLATRSVLFRNVIPIPSRNLNHNFAGLGNPSLAAETRV